MKGWDEVHAFYAEQGKKYPADKLAHSLAVLKEVFGINLKRASAATIKQLLQHSIDTREWMVKGIRQSRAKDYENPFRKMVYENTATMEKVVGKLSENSFIKQEQKTFEAYKKEIAQVSRKFRLDSSKVSA